jgi:NAD(P)-dependent dehydrogenase (short-subunit alcohol dehydrogenase family)
MSTLSDFSVAGKTVLVTGGTGGIGGAFARAFVALGADVVVADVKRPEAGGLPGVRYEIVDVRSDGDVDGLAARTKTLDVLIH